MQLPFFYGLIWGAILGVISLILLSIFNEIPGIRGLAMDVVATPASKTPFISPATSIPQVEDERRPDIKVQSIEISTVAMRTSLDILVTQPLEKPQSDFVDNFVVHDFGDVNSRPSDEFVTAEQTLAPRHTINLGWLTNMQISNIDAKVDTSSGRLVVLPSLKVINLGVSSAQPQLNFTTEFTSFAGQAKIAIIFVEPGRDSIDPVVAVNTKFPVSIAIDSQSENSIARMQKYRAANYEILVQIPVPDHSVAQIALADHLSVLSEAVGIWDAVAPRQLQSLRTNRVLNAELVATQLGYVGQSSEDAVVFQEIGLPAGRVGFYIGQKMTRAADILEQLDAAGMAALETGEAIIALHLNEDTLDILQFWVRHSRVPKISIAPLSVVLLAS
tara:strand:- start:742 stop:1905 length:1164 start_codon:yes stop_codon:yes gene_type:complete